MTSPKSPWRLVWKKADTFFVIMFGLTVLVTAWLSSDLDGIGYGTLWICGIVLVVLGLLWLVFLVGAVRIRELGVGLLLSPLLVAALVVMLNTQAPAEARFAAARGGLDQWAQGREIGMARPDGWTWTDDAAVPDGVADALEDCPQSLAGYRFTGCEKVFGGVALWVPTTSLFKIGLVYSPDGAPLAEDPTSWGAIRVVEPMSGDWYRVYVFN